MFVLQLFFSLAPFEVLFQLELLFKFKPVFGAVLSELVVQKSIFSFLFELIHTIKVFKKDFKSLLHFSELKTEFQFSNFK